MKLPMQLTVMRIALAAVFLVLFAIMEPPQTLWAVIVFIVASVTDWWDGHIARRMQLETELGAFLDPLADKLLTGAAFVSFALKGLAPWWMVVIILLRDIYLTLLRVAVDAEGLSVHTSKLAKVKTFAQMVFISTMLAVLLVREGALYAPVGAVLGALADVILFVLPMWLVTALTAISAIGYTIDNWAIIRTLTRRYMGRTGSERI